MSDVLHIPARPDARIACDMSTAVDTPDQRLGAYAELFADALIRRERGEHSVVFAFRDDAQTRATVEDLVRREAACCPFVDYRLETVGEELVWTTTNPTAGEEGVGAEVMLDAFHELPDQAAVGMEGFFERLAARGVEVIEAPGGGPGWEFRRVPA